VGTSYRESDAQAPVSPGTSIKSFQPCADAAASEDCGWSPDLVGQCSVGALVTVQIENCTQGTQVRACKGVLGCDSDANHLDYAGRLGHDHTCQLTFPCKESHYSIMTKPGPAVLDQLDAGSSDDAGEYPAPEADVFSFREGAFYGDMFEPESLLWNIEMQPDGHIERHELHPDAGELDDPVVDRTMHDAKVPYLNMYACYSLRLKNDEDGNVDNGEGEAYLDNRVCADPPSAPPKGCFPHPPKRCHYQDAGLNTLKGDHCAWLSDAGVYQRCLGHDGTSYPPITTYIDDPCSLVDKGECAHLCEALLKAGRPCPPRQ
jgi:hypothetical protein